MECDYELLKKNVINRLPPLCNTIERAVSRNLLKGIIIENKKKLIADIDICGGFAEIALSMGFNSIGKCLITLSKDIVKSEWELLFSNFFFLNGIYNEYETKVPDVNGSKYKCDYEIPVLNKINNYYLEIWGFENVKSNYCRSNDYNLKRKKN